MLGVLFLAMFSAYHDDFHPSKSQIQVLVVQPTPKMVPCGPSLAFDFHSKKRERLLAPYAGEWRAKEMNSE